MKKKAVSMLALLMAVLLCLSGCSQSEKPRSEAQSAEQIIQEEIVVDEEAVQAQSIGLTGVLNARELGGYLLTLSTDAHHDSEVGVGYEKRIELLKKIGFTHCFYYKNRKLVPVSL